MTEIEEAVRERYAGLAREVASRSTSCCDTSSPWGSGNYDPSQLAGLPTDAVAASLGCGNPVVTAELREGETVLDLGSGGGIDVLLSARRVGPSGFAYGLDMTGEMLELARKNQEAAGVENARFLEGRMEQIPLPDETVDVVISNCVVNLSPNKGAVFAEAFRVLRPSGRLVVSDVVTDRELDERVRSDLEAWAGCLAGALTRDAYRAGLEAAGFASVSIDDVDVPSPGFASSIVRARKP